LPVKSYNTVSVDANAEEAKTREQAAARKYDDKEAIEPAMEASVK
jgi:hypothetical protein